ncbi:hypothetical protein MKQ68_13645 [Chitinophaga horti]|uniref:Cytochrome B n=1 Tax=Chitinophaga horti TaxID=2920382 RepID=A0ABY6IUT4_9BACT|nr:hypothetical protein [Chitinophaga horti]UYQ91137.1 hypothetical protein MKQ68_13645 [Chitinophaga horti]
MYFTLLSLHSINRWLVLISLLAAIAAAANGYLAKRKFSGMDNTLRHVTATIAHIQLMLGSVLYFFSPIVKLNSSAITDSTIARDHTFFSLIHAGLMIVAAVVITIGSAMAKRVELDQQKYKTILTWFSIGLLIILVAIPWPFSPLAKRSFITVF